MKGFFELFFGFISFLAGCHSYVAVQKQKSTDKPQSLDLDNNGTLKDQQSRRNWNNYKRFEIRQRAEENEDLAEPASENGKVLESLILTVDTGAKSAQSSVDSSHKSNPLDMIQKAIQDAVRLPNSPIYRAQEEYNIKPQLVHFRSQANPSLKVDIESKSIVRALKDLLASSAVRRYTDIAAKNVAVVYSALRDEFSKIRQREKPVY